MSFKSLFLILNFTILVGCSSTVKEVPQWTEDQLVCVRPQAELRGPASDQTISNQCMQVFQASGTDVSVVQVQIPTEELQRQWRNLSLGQVFDAVENPEYWARLINLTRVESYEGKTSHPIEAFGEESALAWSRADRVLNEIPTGELKFTPKLIQSIHRVLAQGVDIQKQKIAKYIPFGREFFMVGGGRWRKRVLLHDYVSEAMSEEAYQQLLRNKPITNVTFVQVPWSRVGKRYGYVLYLSPKSVPEKIQSLLNWVNSEMASIRSQKPGAKDPIALAAEFQFRFVALHPFFDVNGRLSRLLMTRILAEFGLPPSSRYALDRDYDLPLDKHIANVREGVARTIKRLQDNQPDPIPTIWKVGEGTNVKELRHNQRALRKLKPRQWSEVIRFGDKAEPMVFGMDGFFYNRFGIPHVLHNKRLWPIADATYRLYGKSGQISDEKGVRRALNPEHQKLVDSHVEFLKKIDRGDVDPDNVNVASYQIIREANLHGEYYFHDFQWPLLSWSSEIRDNPVIEPMATLSQNRGDPIRMKSGGTTRFEQAWLQTREEIGVGDVIGQYELRDLDFAKLQDWAEKNLEGDQKEIVLGKVWLSRKALHRAGRKMLEPFFERMESLDEESRNWISKHPVYRGLKLYMRYSKLGYKTFEEGLKVLGDRHVYLLRAQNQSRTKLLGFRSETDMRDLFKLMPADKGIRKILIDAQSELDQVTKKFTPSEIQEKFEKGEEVFSKKLQGQIAKAGMDARTGFALWYLTHRILASPYLVRGAQDEFQRMFVDMYLHAVYNAGPKSGISTTVNPSLLTKVRVDRKTGEEKIAFASSEGEGAIYIFRAPREDVSVQYGSTYDAQYEVYIKDTLGTVRSWFAVRHKLKIDDLKVPQTPAPAGAQKFLDEGFRLRRGLDFNSHVFPVNSIDKELFTWFDVR